MLLKVSSKEQDSTFRQVFTVVYDEHCSAMTVVEFHSEAGKFNRFLHPNEHPLSVFWYLVRLIDWEPSKIGHIFTK